VKPGKKVRLKDHDTGWAQTKEMKERGKGAVKGRAKEVLEMNLEGLAQELLYADNRYGARRVASRSVSGCNPPRNRALAPAVNPMGD
jgi:hypothetical protein